VCQQSAAAHGPICCGAPDAAAPAWLLLIETASCRCCDCRAEGSTPRHPAHTANFYSGPRLSRSSRGGARSASPRSRSSSGGGRSGSARSRARRPSAGARVAAPPPPPASSVRRQAMAVRARAGRSASAAPDSFACGRAPRSDRCFRAQSHRLLLQQACRGCASAHCERRRRPLRSPQPPAAHAQRNGAHAQPMNMVL
jgi:hypothetical protein